MKSEDIIKAMMQCYAMDCDGCPFRDKNDCGKCEELIPIAIDLLKKQNEELAAYRAAEQDGTLLRLPCKVGDLLSKLENLQNSVADDVETYTTGYRNGHRNGQAELIRYILGIGTGSVSEAEVALKEQEEARAR